MQKIYLGWFALLGLSVVLGVAIHWLVGLAIVLLPIAVTYIRLKVSPKYRLATDKTMTETD